MSPTVQARRATFRALHLEGCFVLPNPWDVGSAVMLQGLGFKRSRRRAPATLGRSRLPTAARPAPPCSSIFAPSSARAICP
jgi:hypothetical protein